MTAVDSLATAPSSSHQDKQSLWERVLCSEKRVCSRLRSPSVQVIKDAQPEASKFGWQTSEHVQLAASFTSQTCVCSSRQQGRGFQSVIVALAKESSLLNCHNKCVKTDPLGTAEKWSHQACHRCCQCMLLDKLSTALVIRVLRSQLR